MLVGKMKDLMVDPKHRQTLNPAQTVQVLYEATHWMFNQVDEMKLKDKDIFVVLGPTRTGKGTLLAAL